MEVKRSVLFTVEYNTLSGKSFVQETVEIEFLGEARTKLITLMNLGKRTQVTTEMLGTLSRERKNAVELAIKALESF
jgi:hypothetical protein